MGQNAAFIIIKIEDTELVGELSNTYSATVDDIDISSKKIGRKSDGLPGRMAENIGFESLADDLSSDYGLSDMLTAREEGTLLDILTVRVDSVTGDQVVGSEIITQKGYISSVSIDNPDNDKSTMSGTIEIDDATAITAHPAPE